MGKASGPNWGLESDLRRWMEPNWILDSATGVIEIGSYSLFTFLALTPPPLQTLAPAPPLRFLTPSPPAQGPAAKGRQDVHREEEDPEGEGP